MHLVWEELRVALPLIWHGNPYLLSIIGFTLQVAIIATGLAAVIGLPIGIALGLGRFRGRHVLRGLANASLAVPPVLVGAVLYLLMTPEAPLGSLQLIWTREAVIIGQTILALPYIVALTAAAIQALPSGLLSQARLLGAARWQLSLLAVREARIGVFAAVIAGLGTSLSEVAAVSILGGNIYGHTQTLASATLYEVEAAHYADAVAISIVLIVMILILMCGLGLLQHRSGGIRLRFRMATWRPRPTAPRASACCCGARS